MEENRVVNEVVEEVVSQATASNNMKKGLIGLGIAFVTGFVVSGPVKKLVGKIFKKNEIVVEKTDEAAEDDEDSDEE